MKVVPFNPPLPPYQPNERNGTCYAIISDLVEYDYGGQEIIVSTGFDFIHMSASGNGAGGYGGFANLRDAERAAWHEARRINAIFIPAFATARES